MIPLCSAADPDVRRPSFTAPSGAVDCHAHVFGPEGRYPYHHNRTYTPPDASLEQYLALHEALGIERGVLVQPSVYGLDNSATRDALSELRRRGLDYRGVAVVDRDVSDVELDRLHREGFRGVRLNLLFKGGIDWQDLEQLAHRLAEREWHLQFLLDVSQCEALESRLARLPVPVVVDHMGHMPCEKGIDHPGFAALCRLLAQGLAWVKLSGAYRITDHAVTPFEDVVPFAKRLLDANPERCVWGSDWPHPHIPVPMPSDGDLFEELAHWAPSAELRRRVLVDNPERLYFR
ncbi:amidohydrolase family protein [Halomonas campisalis]|uniref:Amidohydrolase family protein n=1 Tax=Billgrantia campisalis TaxID=74661 RepID=A0ABS9PBQ4_9GAMM|nr:amidohydrolase family protein [Halomonas campisalis]MCG6659213.1 amidohydrolase family protein [Halomonas campisalis]MDR5864211.1 amidohydrolase family protein [Halomonas campisalis]